MAALESPCILCFNIVVFQMLSVKAPLHTPPPGTTSLDELGGLFVAALTEDRCVCEYLLSDNNREGDHIRGKKLGFEPKNARRKQHTGCV